MKKMYRNAFVAVLFFSTGICKSQNATFEITYTGFDDEQKTAFEYATELWSHYLISDVPIEIVVHLQILLPGQLGITFPNGELNFPGAPVGDVWYASCLANSIAGEDLSPGEADMEIYLNSFADWYFGTDGDVPAGQYDFVSTCLHEICHGLGFLSLGNKTGTTGSFGLIDAASFAPLTTSFPWPDLDTLPSIYDVYMENAAGTPLITFDNPSDALGTAFTSGLVYCNSPMLVEDNGGERGRIYAPGAFTLGSSLSHWDEASYPPGDPNELMTPNAAAAHSNHSPGPMTLALLDEIGWEIIYDTSSFAVSNIDAEKIFIYPNPVNNELNFSMPSGNYHIAEIYSMDGELIKSFAIQPGDNSIAIDFLSTGNYVVKLSGDDVVRSCLFMKQ